MKVVLLASLLALAACNNTASLPDPSIPYMTPPNALMEAPQNLSTINEVANDSN